MCIEYDDECVTAAETYSCGRKKEPGIVDIIFNSEKGNTTIVIAIALIISLEFCYIFIFFSIIHQFRVFRYLECHASLQKVHRHVF
jgi:hypothetical protein